MKLLSKSEDLSTPTCIFDTLYAEVSMESPASQVPLEQSVNAQPAITQIQAREPIAAIPPFSYAQAAKGRTLPIPQNTSSDKAPTDGGEMELKRTVSAERETGSNETSTSSAKRTASEGRVPESRKTPGSTEELVSTANKKEETRTELASKPKEVPVHKAASVPSSPEYGTTSTSTLPKEEDMFSTGNGSSDSTWDKQSQSSQNGVKGDEKTDAEKDASQNDHWDEEGSTAPAFKEAPPPSLNIWQQRKEAQDAKTKAKQPASQQAPRSPNNTAGQAASTGTAKGCNASLESKKPESKKRGKAAAEEKLAVDTAKGGNKDGKVRVSEVGTYSIGKGCYTALLIHAFIDKPSTTIMAPPPPPGDSISWPTPDSAIGEEKKKPQERIEEGEREKEKENAQISKPSGKKAWTHVPFVPTAVFNTPLPQARRGGRGNPGGGRDAAPRGRHNTSNTNGAEKPSPINQTTTITGDKAKVNGNPLATNSNTSKAKRASSAGPMGAKEQRKVGDAQGADRRKESYVEDVKTGQTRRPSVNDSRRPPFAPVPATPQVSRFTGRIPGGDNGPSTSQGASRSQEIEQQSQSAAFEAQTHQTTIGPERRSEGSIKPSELPKDLHSSQPIRERGEERAGRGRGGYRSRGGVNHTAYSGQLANGYGYAGGHTHQYQPPFASQSRSFSNHERIPSQSQGAFFGQSPPHRSLRSNSRSNHNPGFMSAGGRFSHHSTPQGPSYLPSIQTDLANMFAYQNGGPGIMSAIPFDDPSMQQITLFDMVTTQMEYYFSLDNLCKDMFLRKHMDSQGYVFLSVLAGFNRIVQLTTDLELIRYVCLNSQKIEFKAGSLWQDGRDRLRAREDWDKFVLSKEQRDASAQSDGPVLSPPYQYPEAARGYDDRQTASPTSNIVNGQINFLYQSLDSMAPSTAHAIPGAALPSGTYANTNQPPLSAAVSEFAPSVHSHNSRRFASPDSRSHETKAFTDEEVQNLQILVRQPINSALPPFHSSNSRTFSNGSIDGRNINDELSRFAERQPRSVNGEVFERWVLSRLSLSLTEH